VALDVDFSDLHAAVQRMGAGQLAPNLDLSAQIEALDPIDIELLEGFEIELSKIDFSTGLASVQGRQVLLYIKDHRWGITEALENPGERGRKYHVSDCKTLKGMRANQRFERYVVTNDRSGEFDIAGKDRETGEPRAGRVRLNVCKYCLEYLNYKDYRQNRVRVFHEFKLDDFFQTYSSFFPYLPSRRADAAPDDYTPDWQDVARSYKAGKGYICEECNVNLSDDRGLLHVHHIDGVKNNNARSNLQALCADCHRKQASHDHMFVSYDTIKRIRALRRAQSLGEAGGWDEVFALADPAAHGLLHILRRQGGSPPVVGYEVQGSHGRVVAELELAWPGRRSGIALRKDDIEAASAEGWRVQSIMDALQ